MKNGLPKALEQIQEAGGGLTDGQLLERFVATRDEASFVALLRRHGPMVFGVCRRVLRDEHDAEDAFQATFLILARKAGSVARRGSTGSWLYAVAYHTALEATRSRTRRRARERQMTDMPQRATAADESGDAAGDWRPLLDRELSRLSEKYRAAVVLCDLEGLPQKQAAALLGVCLNTLSSRLIRGRKLLATRLAARGLTLSGGALAALVAADAASAQVSAALVGSTARVAALVAAGQLAAVSTPAVVLMKGVMQAMLMKKLRLAVGAVMMAAALGAVGFTCRPGDEAHAQQSSRPERADGKPLSEVEALRRENELLKYNLQLVLEKSAAQEKELQTLRGRTGGHPQLDQPARSATLPPPLTTVDPVAEDAGRSTLPRSFRPRVPAGSGIPPGETTPPVDRFDVPPTVNRPGTAATPGSVPPSDGPLPPTTIDPGTVPLPEHTPVVPPPATTVVPAPEPGPIEVVPDVKAAGRAGLAGAAKDLEAAVKALQKAQDKAGQQRAAEAVEKALLKVRQELDALSGSSRS